MIYPCDRTQNIEISKVDKMNRDNIINSAALLDLIQAIQRIKRFTSNLDFDDYLDNELVRNTVERNFEIIGKAVR